MHAEVWLSMAVFAFVTSVTPGPNNMMLLASGANFGTRATLPHILGISCGHFIMLMAVGLGLGELFMRVPAIYQAMQVLGMAYLLYLAWGIVRSGPPAVPGDATLGSVASAKPLGFWGAAAFQWVNPKAWVMTLGFFSNYLPQQANLGLIAAAALLFSLVNFPSVAVWAVMGARLGHYLQVTLYRRIFNGSMALLLVASMVAGLFTR
ncbi:LysE family translocator [Limnohabitans sp. B9-3]|uniref:LysE family translocator n=1 Tax=Limnohabitans sp. B9-3 TaxID=1100707 RepID=UPI000C1F5B84|nr:LysE family translocator [Limnohabitans sp. B9-3]PIT72937.1 lysine transporter LysE [Limnohabitans sp. B9-3]